MSDTPALVVCDMVGYAGGQRPHRRNDCCINPRPAATIELPTSSAAQCKAPVLEDGYRVGPCGVKLPCAAHPAPPEGRSPPPTSTPAPRTYENGFRDGMEASAAFVEKAELRDSEFIAQCIRTALGPKAEPPAPRPEQPEAAPTEGLPERVWNEHCAKVGSIHACERLAEAAQRLVERMNFVHAHRAYKSVWYISQLHVGPYVGPTYTAELAALAAALPPKLVEDRVCDLGCGLPSLHPGECVPLTPAGPVQPTPRPEGETAKEDDCEQALNDMAVLSESFEKEAIRLRAEAAAQTARVAELVQDSGLQAGKLEMLRIAKASLEKQLAEAEKKLREQVKLLSEEYRFRQQMEKDAHEKQLAEVTRERDEARLKLRVAAKAFKQSTEKKEAAEAQLAEQKEGEEVLLLAAHDNYQEIKADLQVARDQLAAQAEHCKTSQALRAELIELLTEFRGDLLDRPPPRDELEFGKVPSSIARCSAALRDLQSTEGAASEHCKTLVEALREAQRTICADRCGTVHDYACVAATNAISLSSAPAAPVGRR